MTTMVPKRISDGVFIQTRNGEVGRYLRSLFGNKAMVDHWVRVMVLRPIKEGRRVCWTYGDLRDAITLHRWLNTNMAVNDEFVYVTRHVLDRWRELGRPEDYFIGRGGRNPMVVLEPMERLPLVVASKRHVVVAAVATLDDARDAILIVP
jgi:hypothetical protein